MTKEQKALARLDKARAEHRAAQAEVDRLRQDYMRNTRQFGVSEAMFRDRVLNGEPRRSDAA